MTDAELRNICDLLKAAGRTHVPVPISEWREHMAATIKKASLKTDAKGKTTVKPKDTAPLAAKIARKGKADSAERRLRANREKSKR